MPTASETKRALDRADKLVTLAPERGQRTYVNTAVVEDGTHCAIFEKGYELYADAGRGLGGGDADPTPSMLLRSALSSCIAIGVKLWAARREVPIERVEVIVETDTDARGILGLSPQTPAGFTAIRAHVDVQSRAPREVIEEIVASSLRFSPLIDALANAQRVATSITVSPDLLIAADNDDGL
jgi:uncharacterized OsmC-like protein